MQKTFTFKRPETNYSWLLYVNGTDNNIHVFGED